MQRRGGRLLAVSTDPPERSARVVERNRLPFDILSDGESALTRAFGVLHPGGAPSGADIAVPSHFLLDSNGRVLWRWSAGRISDRIHPGEVLRAIHEQLAQ
ncbi:MAG: redoxin domain-containing protein [Planctomycetia bacterium]|nr:MAG: redoxin domain-containing protein [Planctomycetia bacterium]